MGKQNLIEINGKKYDAATGQLASSADAVEVVKPSIRPQQGVGIVDGFARKPRKPRTQAAHAKKSAQKSKTLVRKAVEKPQPIAKSQKSSTVASISKKSLGTSPKRQQVAKTTAKSPHIKKFDHSAPARSSVVKKNVTVAPKKAPTATRVATTQKPLASVSSHTAKRVATTRAASARMIEQALTNATSHEEEQPVQDRHVVRRRSSKLRRKLGVSSRAVSIASASLAVVLLAGFFAVQNVPNLSMRVAATRAGFDASMPGYNPSGFSFNGPISFNAGRVTVNFSSNSDDRAYSITQRSSNWTSEALLANFIETENKQYQTFLDKGRTLYLYEGSNATWVDDGIWYQIEGDSDLTTDQLVRIASSI